MPKFASVKELKDQRKLSPNQFSQVNEYVWCRMSQLGKGAFGTVFLGWREPDEEYVAVKVIPQSTIDMEEKVKVFLKREIEIMTALQGCAFIVQLMHLDRSKLGVNMFMEMCDTDLEKHLVTNRITQPQLVRFMQQMAIAVNSMHLKGIVHRDLKPANILVKYTAMGSMQDWDIRLADFGYSRFFKTEGTEGLEINNMLDSAAGTPVYMAPEALACVVEQNAHYNQLVDIWSAGAIIYRVVVGEHGFYHRMQMTMQELLNVIRKKGTAIGVVVNPKGKPIYIKELPEQTEDILSAEMKQTVSGLMREMLQVEPQLRMTTAKFLQSVDDIAVSKFRVVSVHTGQQAKLPVSLDMTMDQLRKGLAKEFKDMPEEEMCLVYESHSAENVVGSDEQLRALMEFLTRCSHRPDLFLVSGALLKELDLPYDASINVTNNLSALLGSKSKRELKQQNNTVLLPQVCKSTVEEFQSLQRQQLIGYQAFLSHAGNSLARFNVARARAEKAQCKLETLVNAVFATIGEAADSLQALGFDQEVNSLQTMDDELRELLRAADSAVGVGVEEFDKQYRHLKEIRKRISDLSSDDVVMNAQRMCREISKESLESQLDKSEDLAIFLTSKQKHFTDLFHLKLKSLQSVLQKLDRQQGEMLRMEGQMIPGQMLEVEKLAKRVNKTSLALVGGGGAVRGPAEQYENPEIRNLREIQREMQREKDELSAKAEGMRKEIEKSRELRDKLHYRLEKYNRWFEEMIKELELEEGNGKSDKLQTDDSHFQLDSSIPKDIRNCIRKSMVTDIVKVRETVLRTKAANLSSEEDKISVSNLKAGDQVLLLPSKSTGSIRVHVPRVFTLETEQLYFLDVESYEGFRLEMKKDFTTCVTGILTEDPKPRSAMAKESYPVNQFGMTFYTVKAKPKIQTSI